MNDVLTNLFPGIATLFTQEPGMAFARIFLIGLGFFLAYLGYKQTLEPLLMIPMGLGMISVNAGVLLFEAGKVGTLFVDPLMSDPNGLINILQINFLQPIYTLTFGNGLIACLVFMGIGVMSDVGFLLAKPFTSMFIAICAELGSILTIPIGILMGLTPREAASIAIVGGADGPMVLFTSMTLAKHLFVPITIVAYLYLSLTYAGYPYIIKMLIPKKYRGIEMSMDDFPRISSKAKFVFALVANGVLCLLFPVAAPLFSSFFLGVAVREAGIKKFIELLEGPIMYGSTFFLGLLLGVLCEANTILNPKVFILLVLGIIALFLSAVGGIAGGWIVWWLTKGKYNPVIGIAGVSCVPTTAKLAQKAASQENPFAMILPYAMGPNICGVITTAILTGILISIVPLM